MKKITYYLLLTMFTIIMMPYYIIALVAEYYSRVVICLFAKPVSRVKDYGTLPKWLSSIISYIEKQLHIKR